MKKVKILLNVLVLMVAVGFTACEGDQGEVGPKGDTGANGTGFDELTQYGNVEVTFSGTRGDDVDFSETLNFMYMPISGVAQNSSYYKEDDTYFAFSLGRENKGPVGINGRTENSGFKNNIWMELVKSGEDISVDQMVVYTDILTDDFKTFAIDYNDGYYTEGFQVDITNYSFDAATGKLKFEFSFTIPAINSSTGNEITVTGKADLTVFEKMDMPS